MPQLQPAPRPSTVPAPCAPPVAEGLPTRAPHRRDGPPAPPGRGRERPGQQPPPSARRQPASGIARSASPHPTVRPVPRGWPQFRLALWCGALPLVSGLSITAIAATTESSAVFSTMILAGLLTLGLGVILFVVGWAALFEHGRRVRQRTPEELASQPAPPAEVAGLLLLLNLPTALACLSIGMSQAAANPAFC